ncbi:unnamed protein product [Aphanomyces euteiches]|nr:hypothetical protein AeRB84_000465 [Aphanomyces euteiches]
MLHVRVDHQDMKRRLTALPSVSRRVFLYPNVLTLITDYQPGVFLDMRPMTRLSLPKFHSYDLKATWKSIGAVLAPWLEQYHTSRLYLLFTSIPHTKVLFVYHAIISGDLPLLQFIHKAIDLSTIPYFLIDIAAWAGHLYVLAYLRTIRHPGQSIHALDMAARYGHMPVVNFLQKHCPADGASSMVAAATSGHLNIVEFLHKHRSNTSGDDAMDVAAAGGHLDVVEWLHSKGNKSWRALSLAASNGHAHVMAFLLKVQVHWGPVSMDVAASKGYVNVIQLLLEHTEVTSQHRAIDAAAADGHLEIVQLLHQSNIAKSSVKAIDTAAANGHLDIVAFLHHNSDVGCTPAAMDDAAAKGHLSVVQFLNEHRKEGCTTSAMDVAAARGHLDIVKYLHTNRKEGCTKNAMDGAATRGHLEIVKYLHHNRTEGCTQAAIEGASRNNHHTIVEFLVKNCYKDQGRKTQAIDAAISNGNLQLVGFLMEHGHKPTAAALEHTAWNFDDKLFNRLFPLVRQGNSATAVDTAVYAAAHGRRALFETAISLNPSGATEETLIMAAAKGHLGIVQTLIEKRIQPPTAAMDKAAANGHLNIVKYLHSHKGRPTVGAMNLAATNGHFYVVEWLDRHCFEGCTTDAMDDACRNGHLDIAKYIYARRGETGSPKALYWAARGGWLTVVEWLVTNLNHEWSIEDAMSAAASMGHIYVLNYLTTTFCHVLGEGVLIAATEAGHLDVVKWILHVSGDIPTRAAIKAATATKREVIASFLTSVAWERDEDDDESSNPGDTDDESNADENNSSEYDSE